MGFIVRKIRHDIEDTAALLSLVRQLADYEREPDAVEATAEGYLEQLKSPRPPFEALLAQDDGKIVGMALFFQNYSTWTGRPGIFVEDVFVLPSHRGRGIGRELFAQVGAAAVARGCPRMDWMVLDWNSPAIAFYNGLGAKPMDEWTTFRLSGAAIGKITGEKDRP